MNSPQVILDNNFGLTFHHFGLAVKKPTTAITYLTGLGYRCDPEIYDPLQKVNLMMCWHISMPAVEVIFPSKESGPLDSMLSKRPEGIVYHLCYESPQRQLSLNNIESSGLRLIEIAPPKPAILFDNRLVSFYMISGMGLIEIIG